MLTGTYLYIYAVPAVQFCFQIVVVDLGASTKLRSNDPYGLLLGPHIRRIPWCLIACSLDILCRCIRRIWWFRYRGRLGSPSCCASVRIERAEVVAECLRATQSEDREECKDGAVE